MCQLIYVVHTKRFVHCLNKDNLKILIIFYHYHRWGGKFSWRGGLFSRKFCPPGGEILRGGRFTFTPVLSTDLPGSFQTAFKSTSKSTTGKVLTDQPSDLAGADSPLSRQVPSRSSSAPIRRQSTSSMDTDSDSDISDRPPVDLFVEEGELSDQDLEASAADPDLTLSEEQNYRETMSGIRSFMGWSDILEMDTTASRSEDNPFTGPKTQPTGKISVSMPTDEWLCSKMGKLNLTLTEGYPSRSSEASGLFKDQFVRPPRSQAKWYSFVPNRPSDEQDPKTVHSWNTDSSKVNST